MEDIRLLIGYTEWIILVGLTLGFFSFYSKKYKKIGSLIALVLISDWMVIAIIKGLEYIYFDNTFLLFSPKGFLLLLAETLPMLLVFGGITFTIKYFRFKKSRN